MNQMRDTGFASDAAYLEARLGLVSLRLTLEVNRLRALRADGRRENFAGVLMQDDDIAALCAELVGAGLPDMTQDSAQLGLAQEHFAARLAATRPLPLLERLFALYGLSGAEQALVLLALAPALDARFGRIYGFLHEDMSQQYLTLGLAQRIAAHTAGGGIDSLRAALSPQGVLRRHAIVTLSGTAPLISQQVTLGDAMVDLLMPDAAVPADVTVLPLPGRPRPADHPKLVTATNGVDAAILGQFEGPLWLVDAARCSLDGACVAGVAAALADANIAYTGWDTASPQDRHRLAQSLGRHGAVFTTRPAKWEGMDTTWQAIAPREVAQTHRHAFWAAIAPPELADVLAAETVLPTATLWRMTQQAAQGPGDAAARLAQMMRHQGSEPMQGLADRVATPFDFDDLVLPSRTKARLQGFADRRRSAARVLEDWGLGPALGAGRGGIALFTGPSGVGKTMSAGVVAKAAGLDLWRINLATVVSKYIGETESNLEQIFTAAGEAEVMLFFDEAEALFSKRAEVRDARDRYANMEMSYLLQRLEGFPGMAVLASNMATTLDPALMRRFDLVLEFTLPEAPARREIWAKLEQANVPLGDDIDLDHIAEAFELAGGHIKQAILSAAHSAAQSQSAVTQLHLLRAVAREYGKLGKSLRRDAFGDAFAQVRGEG